MYNIWRWKLRVFGSVMSIPEFGVLRVRIFQKFWLAKFQNYDVSKFRHSRILLHSKIFRNYRILNIPNENQEIKGHLGHFCKGKRKCFIDPQTGQSSVCRTVWGKLSPTQDRSTGIYWYLGPILTMSLLKVLDCMEMEDTTSHASIQSILHVLSTIKIRKSS